MFNLKARTMLLSFLCARSLQSARVLQVYLIHKKLSTPQDHHRVLRIGLPKDLRGGRFLMSEVPLYTHAPRAVVFKYRLQG